MRLPRRRIRTTRRLSRPGHPSNRLAAGPVPHHEAPAEAGVPSILKEMPPPSMPQSRLQESTVELVCVAAEILGQNEGSDALRVEPQPPPKMEFACACGARLIATSETYDKHSRCALCQAVMLLSLVYDGDRRSFEIVPFRISPETDP